MNLALNAIKILGSGLTITFTAIGLLWSGFAILAGMMDSKVAIATYQIAEVRHAELGELKTEIRAVNQNIGAIAQQNSIMYAELLRRRNDP